MDYKNEKLEKFNNSLQNKRVAIIGLGVSNLPLIDYLKKLNAKIVVFDNKKENKLEKEVLDIIAQNDIEFYYGENYLENLRGFDFIFRSPSCRIDVPEIRSEIERGAVVTTEIEILLKLCPGKTIGITGSDGKTTTTSLIYEIVKEAGYNCYLGGNIGIPLFTEVYKMKPDDIVVLELSSFQLMDMKISPNISVITNITPNHLDIHKSYDEYIESKKNIFKFQGKDDILVLNYDNEITRDCEKEAKGEVVFFSKKTKLENGIILDNNIIKQAENGIRRHLLNTQDVILRGMHNYENICTAIAATQSLVDVEVAAKAVKKFKGVEHRIEFVREINSVKWYNDSIGSSPTRTIAGLNSFDEEIVLIAGGYDKNLDYTPLAKPIIDKVNTLILLGQTADKIEKAVTEAGNRMSGIGECRGEFPYSPEYGGRQT
ncbi:MAG: UDP-N-acetylmuramoyl-L-alanine--D-glutamate ligase [Oscillospiraceae bacterium]|nr:UDP-N-acetylmuramoyl-L-alanine--D-glutamate ligase [Oscillospiraceae bacterium]